MTSPTQRTLKYLRDQGFMAEVVEKQIPHTFIKRDLFNWIDIVAIHPTLGLYGIQVTSGSNLAARMHKAVGNKALAVWLQTGSKLVAHGWRKLKGKWTPDIRELNIYDIATKDMDPVDPLVGMRRVENGWEQK